MGRAARNEALEPRKSADPEPPLADCATGAMHALRAGPTMARSPGALARSRAENQRTQRRCEMDGEPCMT